MANSAGLLPNDRGLQAEDDSPFLSIADFFSLISLSLIYLIVTFSPAAPVNDSAVEAITGAASGTGPASATPTRIAYVVLVPSSTGLLVRVIQPGADTPAEHEFKLTDAGTLAASGWIVAQLLPNPDIERVMFSMNANDHQDHVYKSFWQLVSLARAHFKVNVLFMDEDNGSP